MEKQMTEHDLMRHLADTLVEQEVMKPMNSIGWGHGAPPSPSQSDNPAASGGAPEAAMAGQGMGTTGTTPTPNSPQTGRPQTDMPPANLPLDLESFKDPSTGEYLGKYKTPEEFVKGIGHAVTMAKQAFSERDQIKAEMERLRSQISLPSQSQPTVPPAVAPNDMPDAIAAREAANKASKRLEQVLSKVAEEGGFLDGNSATDLLSAMRESQEAAARATAEELLLRKEAQKAQEQAKWSQVDEYMSKNHPESSKFADEIELYVQSDPLVAEAVTALAAQGKELRAAEFAWLSFDKARTGKATSELRQAAEIKEISLQAAEQVRKEAVENARRDAGVIPTSASGVHESVNMEPTSDEVEAAARAMRAYGTHPGNAAAARWRELTIGRFLPPDL